MNCFLCGRGYDETKHRGVARVGHADADDTIEICSVISRPDKGSYAHRTFRLCPDCVRACTFGIVLNDSNMVWYGNDLEFEDEIPDEEIEGKNENPVNV